MAEKKKKKEAVLRAKARARQREVVAAQSEMAMIGAILDGSPDAVGVAVVRLDCGCRKMAAVDKEGEPASKIIMYRDSASSICDLCKEDDGGFARVREEFIHWQEPAPDEATRRRIVGKVLGSHAV